MALFSFLYLLEHDEEFVVAFLLLLFTWNTITVRCKNIGIRVQLYNSGYMDNF